MKMENNIFASRLIQLREARRLSQIATAKEIGISTRGYQNYEYGKAEPKLSALIKISDFFGVSLDYLAGRSDTP